MKASIEATNRGASMAGYAAEAAHKGNALARESGERQERDTRILQHRDNKPAETLTVQEIQAIADDMLSAIVELGDWVDESYKRVPGDREKLQSSLYTLWQQAHQQNSPSASDQGYSSTVGLLAPQQMPSPK